MPSPTSFETARTSAVTSAESRSATASGDAMLHCDNSAAKAISECQIKLTSLMRHIAVRHLYVRELVYKGVVVLKWVPSAENIADLGTKALDEKTFDMLVRMILEFGG